MGKGRLRGQPPAPVPPPRVPATAAAAAAAVLAALHPEYVPVPAASPVPEPPTAPTVSACSPNPGAAASAPLPGHSGSVLCYPQPQPAAGSAPAAVSRPGRAPLRQSDSHHVRPPAVLCHSAGFPELQPGVRSPELHGVQHGAGAPVFHRLGPSEFNGFLTTFLAELYGLQSVHAVQLLGALPQPSVFLWPGVLLRHPIMGARIGSIPAWRAPAPPSVRTPPVLVVEPHQYPPPAAPAEIQLLWAPAAWPWGR
mmetsp:Transcript_121749/g.211445  ORF Transcript_121749/g.211445 Transcript_121749/m.211445 type:complete len:253 (-) Transcript_121749:753-1511(-)